ncbi:MAG: hypothetical protein ACQESK_08620 [Bacteroidota bacterium]
MKYYILILFTIIGLNISFAQDDDQIHAMKVAYFTKELKLSSADAEKFWPVYNKHTDKYRALKKEDWKSIKERLKNIQNLSQQEAEDLLSDYVEYQENRLKYRKDYIEELQQIISAKKIMLLKKAEYDFNKKLLKQYQSQDKAKD